MSDPMDTKLRELTYRLIAMAPEAPPFPEEPMVQLKPAPAPAPPARRRSPLVWLAAAAAITLLVVGVPLFLSRGDTTPTVPPATQPTVPGDETPTTTPPVDATTLRFNVYLYSNEVTTPNGHAALLPVQRSGTVESDSIESRVALALESLVTEPAPDGFSSMMPLGIETVELQFADGVVTFDIDGPFGDGADTAELALRFGQVVFTATQFPEVDGVRFTDGGVPVDDAPLTREGFFVESQAIYVDTPAVGATVASPFRIAGTANVFEATLQYEIVTDDGEVIASDFSTATCGTGCWGDFEVSGTYALDADTTGVVNVFVFSAEDGSRQNVIAHRVQLLASESGPDALGSCSTTGLDVALAGQAGLPAPVAEMRQAIYDAAMACDIPALAALADAGEEPFTASFGGGDAATFWIEGESRGQTVLADLVRHLNQPVGVDDRVDPTFYVWPSAHMAISLDDIPEEDYAALLELYSAEELQNMYEVVGGYVGWRIGIDETGDWRYFVAGD